MAPSNRSAENLRIVIIGAGMAGICASIKLTAAGYPNHVVYEKADKVGGTWRENTYPGLSCDVPAQIYTYSFEPNPEWNSTFATGSEIYDYFHQVAEKHGVYDKIYFGEEITHCEFEDGRWSIRTGTGREDCADIVIAATGVLHHPLVADIPDLETFEGASFHSARWDHDIDLDGKRVGVIGTGSTAIQLASALVDRVERFDLFQRTAQWVMPIEDIPFTDEQKSDYRAHPEKLTVLREELIAEFADFFSNAVIDADSPAIKQIEAACLENLENNVTDPELREELRPDYRAACKRLIFSTDFYDAIQRPNANLITAGIEKVEPQGVRTADGKLHELDVLVVATGFKVDAFIRPTTVLGRKGVNLDDVWAHHPVAYLAISVPEFPNFFMLDGPNGPVGNISLITVVESQMDYVLQLLDEIKEGRCKEISATQDAATRFEAERREAALSSIWSTGCNSWYLDQDGVPATWPWGPTRFRKEMSRPDLDAFDRA